tara:strand:- start:360 stop:542 length:183 start_codon:yes stop_codon:yes gene_type:complete
MKDEIMRFRYRIGKERSKEVIATKKICLKKREELLRENNGNIKISKTVPASTHPNGAPHV